MIAAASVASAGPAEQLREMGGLVMPIAQSDSRRDVALHLADGEVTDQTLETIVALNAADAAQPVAWLNLAGTQVTDAGAESLAKLTELERLHIERTALTDAGLAKLAGLKKLSYLNLYGTQITDAGLETIAQLPNLKKVFVWQTGVSEEAIARFNQDHPKTEMVGEVKLVKVEFPEEEEKQDGDKEPAKKEDAKKEDAKKDPETKKDAAASEKDVQKTPADESVKKDGSTEAEPPTDAK